MTSNRLAHQIAMTLPTFGRSFDIGEEEGDGTAGQRLAFGYGFRQAIPHIRTSKLARPKADLKVGCYIGARLNSRGQILFGRE
jgi:hypothetical protein